MIRWLVFLLWVCVAAQAQEGAPKAAAEQAALAVEVAQATRVAHERSLAADGVVVARELAAVNAQVAGVSLAKLNADVGDRVQAGQPLLEVNLNEVRGKVPSVVTPVIFTDLDESYSVKLDGDKVQLVRG